MKKVAIIGGGLGGLSAAITLSANNYDVTLFEKNGHLGGKLMEVKVGDASFDFGPNTITMPDVFREVVSQTGDSPDDYFDFIKLSTHTRNIAKDGTIFDFTTDKEKMIEQLHSLDSEGAKNYPAFIEEVTRLYQLGEKHFFRKAFTSTRDYLSPSLGISFSKVRPLQSLHRFHKKYFKNPFVVQALDRYATYIGSSPYASPATFALIAYLELVDGVYYTKGGNINIAAGFKKAARKLGVNLKTNCKIASIEVKNKQAISVTAVTGERYETDMVIMNADLLSAYPELVREVDRPHFSNPKAAAFEPSISAFVLLAETKVRYSELLHHTVYFSDNYQNEFQHLFEERKYPNDPTIYLCNSSYTDQAKSPNGDNLFILANAPGINEQNVKSESDYKNIIYETLDKRGLSIQGNVLAEKIISPSMIQDTFGAFRGSLYGLASNKKRDAFFRPSNKAADIGNLYFVGGSTHPGGGSPLVTLSGLNVAHAIIRGN
ncbi:Diapolycopene oxygenase [Bacillus sp. THAF10]|uniref:phytoene desaturase family protein n=1 Tax=Bacillus sp. THAF10 TaxID=2587848 RepID=UPI0012691732|nr:phytoene desaturase family protein [Bacillus sp. THAF10]QFT88327.1 Diapolycopene oxygenase [Bacillus sp. THAF10]